MKREWTRPELTVLVRGTREELVLAVCKGGAMSGPSNDVDVCRGVGQDCPDCSGVTTS